MAKKLLIDAGDMSKAKPVKGGLLGADFSDVSQPGFNRRTNVVASNDNGRTYAASLTNPFPAGVDRPEGASAGLATFLGRSPGYFAADGRRPGRAASMPFTW